jgi:hypothetical protein
MIVPMVVPVRPRADPFPPLSQKLLLIECLLVLKHEVDGPTQLMGKDREGLGLAVFMDQSIEISFCRIIPLEEKNRCFREGPFEMGIANLVAMGTVFLPIRFMGALYQATV